MAGRVSLHLARGHVLLFVILAIAFAVFSYFFYRRRPSGAIGRDWPLAILRGAGLSLLLFALFEPVAGMLLNLRQRPLVPILIDTSSSMSIEDVSPDRLRAAEKVVQTALLPSLRKKAEAKLFSFSGHVETVSESLSPSGNVTDIGGAIKEIPGVLGRQPSALVMVTDGASNVGENPVAASMESGFPIYVIGVGDPGMKKDVLVKSIRTNEIAYAGDEIPVEADIESKGFEGQKTKVSVHEGSALVDAKEITLSGLKQEQSVTLNVNPKTPGLHTYRVAVEPLESELTKDNNSRSFGMQVLKSKINVLFIGKPSWDGKFLALATSEDKNLSLSQLVLLGKSKYTLLTGDKKSEGRLPSKPGDLAPYDVVVIDNPAKGELSSDFGKLMADFVSSEGKGVLLLGSVSGLPPALGPLVPVVVGPGESGKQVKFELTAEGLAHPAVSLATDIYESESMWKGLPPVQVQDRVLGLKSGATALGLDPTTKTAQGAMPVIAVQTFGKGKTMCILTNESWKWFFMPVGLGKSSTPYTILFGNVFRWLVARQELDRLRVRTDKNVYTSGETVTFSAELYDENYKPEDGADVRVKVLAKEEIELPLAGTGRGRYSGSLDALPAGEFALRTVAYKGKEAIAESRGKVVVEELSLESTETRMREDELEAIASASGGRYFSLAQADSLPGELKLESAVEKKRVQFDLKTSPLLFLVAVAIFGAEWIWRKRRGLP
jgi:hypothetical protein